MSSLPPPFVPTFAEIEQEFVQRAHAMVWCNVATVDEHGRPRSRVMHPIWQGGTGWITTGRGTAKLRQIAASGFVSLAYIADPFKPVYADCRAVWRDDREAKRHIWDLFARLPEPLGGDLTPIWGSVDSPHFGVLVVTPWRVELYDLLNQSNRKTWCAEDQPPLRG